MSEASDEYLKLSSEFEEIREERDCVFEFIRKVSLLIQNNKNNFHFSHMSQSVPSLASYKTDVPNGEFWPTAEQIQDIQVRWHKAYDACKIAYGKLSKVEKTVMKKPEDFY